GRRPDRRRDAEGPGLLAHRPRRNSSDAGWAGTGPRADRLLERDTAPGSPAGAGAAPSRAAVGPGRASPVRVDALVRRARSRRHAAGALARYGPGGPPPRGG